MNLMIFYDTFLCFYTFYAPPSPLLFVNLSNFGAQHLLSLMIFIIRKRVAILQNFSFSVPQKKEKRYGT